MTPRRIDSSADGADIGTGADLRLEYRGEPFTGEVVETVGEQLLSLTAYVDGIPHGLDLEWWADGGRKSEGRVEHGLPVGVWRRWHHNGTLAVEKHFDDTGDLEDVRAWDEDGNEIDGDAL
ncbi:toxin-antitoxin system YwqK family antitoxin [Nocardia thailandica]|uniref:Toxin-antitoxin system YwqK family antitoxin n=1 Tax=Nocardia thailandica TaxID=257275 RepID=A0ABW6PJI8_9NOCA